MSAFILPGSASTDVVTLEIDGLLAGILGRSREDASYRLFAARKALRPLEALTFASVEEARQAVGRQLTRGRHGEAAVRWLAA